MNGAICSLYHYFDRKPYPGGEDERRALRLAALNLAILQTIFNRKYESSYNIFLLLFYNFLLTLYSREKNFGFGLKNIMSMHKKFKLTQNHLHSTSKDLVVQKSKEQSRLDLTSIK